MKKEKLYEREARNNWKTTPKSLKPHGALNTFENIRNKMQMSNGKIRKIRGNKWKTTARLLETLQNGNYSKQSQNEMIIRLVELGTRQVLLESNE